MTDIEVDPSEIEAITPVVLVETVEAVEEKEPHIYDKLAEIEERIRAPRTYEQTLAIREEIAAIRGTLENNTGNNRHDILGISQLLDQLRAAAR